MTDCASSTGSSTYRFECFPHSRGCSRILQLHSQWDTRSPVVAIGFSTPASQLTDTRETAIYRETFDELVEGGRADLRRLDYRPLVPDSAALRRTA